MNTKVTLHLPKLSIAALLIALGAGLATTAHAQWGWSDKDGRRVFSDQAPSSDIPESKIFKRPAGALNAAAKDVVVTDTTALAAAGDAQSAAKPKAATSAPKLSGKDSELEKKKKETEAAESAKKKVEADKIASQKAENCEMAKRSKSNLSSGTRIATTNAKGEREIMSDTDRANEAKRMDDVIANSCK